MPFIKSLFQRRRTPPQTLTILYNGGCSICAPEISAYQNLAIKAGCKRLVFHDVAPEVLSGVMSVAYLKRFHVRVDDQEVSGIAAFILLWERLPYFYFISKIISLPIIFHVFSWGYNTLAAPFLYWRFMRQQGDQGAV